MIYHVKSRQLKVVKTNVIKMVLKFAREVLAAIGEKRKNSVQYQVCM
jgi:hypothetical protein